MAGDGPALSRRRDVAGPHRYPMGPADQEAGDAPKGQFDKARRSARRRKGDGQPRDDEGERERPRDGDRPARDAAPAKGREARREQEHPRPDHIRSEEHTSELQSLMRISYAVFCLKKKNQILNSSHKTTTQDKHTQPPA